MIQTKILRIGSVVKLDETALQYMTHNKNKLYSVIQISPYTIRLKGLDYEEHSENLEYVDLTDDLLTTLDFVKVTSKYFTNRIPIYKDGGKYYFEVFTDKGSFKIYIDFLHELQNLYQTIFKEELDVTKLNIQK